MLLSKYFLICTLAIFTFAAKAEKQEQNNDHNDKKKIVEPYITIVSPQDLQSVRIDLEKLVKNEDRDDDKSQKSEINFGDGTISSKTDELHTYAEPGIYTITSKIWLNKIKFLSFQKQIEVNSDFKLKNSPVPAVFKLPKIKSEKDYSF